MSEAPGTPVALMRLEKPCLAAVDGGGDKVFSHLGFELNENIVQLLSAWAAVVRHSAVVVIDLHLPTKLVSLHPRVLEDMAKRKQPVLAGYANQMNDMVAEHISGYALYSVTDKQLMVVMFRDNQRLATMDIPFEHLEVDSTIRFHEAMTLDVALGLLGRLAPVVK